MAPPDISFRERLGRPSLTATERGLGALGAISATALLVVRLFGGG